MRAKQYRYTAGDLAYYAGLSESSVYKAIDSGRLNPDDLESVVSWILDKRPLFGRTALNGDKL